MDDVDMPDAGSSAAPKSKAVSKTAKVGGAADEGKKRFEVKKVRTPGLEDIRLSRYLWLLVECCGFVGVGYCCG